MCLVAPHDLDQMEEWASEAFSGVRSKAAEGEGEKRGPSTTAASDAAVPSLEAIEAEGPEGGPLRYGSRSWPEWRYDDGTTDLGFEALVPGGRLGVLYNVRPKRELRELELVWYLPFGSMRDVRWGEGEGVGGARVALCQSRNEEASQHASGANLGGWWRTCWAMRQRAA